MKLILITGADRCGKDILAREIAMRIKNSQIESLATPLVEVATLLLAIFTDLNCGIGFYDRNKDVKLKELGDRSMRDLIIYLAETFIKPLFGDDCFARAMLKKASSQTLIIPDCRFQSELQYFKKAIGAENIALIHLFSPFGSGTIASGEGLLKDPDILIYKVDLSNPDAVNLFLEAFEKHDDVFYRC